MQQYPEAVRAQIAVAAANYRRTSAATRAASGCPSAATTPARRGAAPTRASATSSSTPTASLDATPAARATASTRRSTARAASAAFGRDIESSQQVWSAEGYPGDSDYREFYRDIGYDLDYDYIRPYIQPDGDPQEHRHQVLPHHRQGAGTRSPTTRGGRASRPPSTPATSCSTASGRSSTWPATWTARRPIVVSPYDAELFGHWWYEGPEFLDFLIRKMAFDQKVFRLATPARVPAREPRAPGGDARRSAPGATGATPRSGSTAPTTGSTATCTRRPSA